MPNIKTDISPLLLHKPQESNEIISLLISHPSPQETEILGLLFMIIKLSPASESTKKIVSTIQQEGKIFYYQQLESNIELAFESTLKKFNEILSNHLEHISAEWLNDFNALIGVIKGTDLYFSQVGDLQAFLIHRQRVINILEKTKGSETRINPLKIFSQTISGQLNTDDAIFITSSSILDYLSLERIRTVIQSETCQQASLTLENLLIPSQSTQSFAALIIKQTPETVTIRPETKGMTPTAYGSMASQESMERLIHREDSTNQLLTPSLWLTVKRIGQPISQGVKTLTEKIGLKQKYPVRKRPEQVSYYTPIRELNRINKRPRYSSRGVFILGRIFMVFQYIGIGLKKFFIFLLNLISGRKHVKQKLQHLPTTATTSVSRQIVFFQKLSRQRKILLLVAVLLIFVFSQSIIYISHREETKKQQTIYQGYISQAQAQEEDAEAALLYGDEDGAKSLLKQAQELVASIPEKDRENKYKADIAAIQTKIDALITKTKHINSITDPTLLVDLTGLNQEISVNNYVGLFGNSLVAFSNIIPELYLTDIEKKETTTLSYKEKSEQLGRFSSILSARIGLIYLSDDSILQYDSSNNSLTTLPISFENQDKGLVAMTTYSNRVYLLDTKNNQILRHQRVGNEYTKGVGWIAQTDANITNGVDIAVDGSVYVLHSDGQLSKFYQGQFDNTFSLKEIDPVLSKPTKLITNEELTYIYVLEPEQHRLLVFTKKGGLKNQYTSDSFDNLLGLTVNEKDKKAYLLNGTKIFVVDLLE